MAMMGTQGTSSPLDLFGCAPLYWGAEPSTPYAGQERREIKALSAEEIAGYLSGSGIGLAKGAELNHDPGPRHVLDLAEPLQLSDELRQQTQAIFAAMRTEVVRLGTQLMARVRQLDTLFAAGTISEAPVEQLVTEMATIQGQLRAVHLRAHLAPRALLTPDQRRRYDALRGYTASRHDHSGPHRSSRTGGGVTSTMAFTAHALALTGALCSAAATITFRQGLRYANTNAGLCVGA